MKMLIAALVTSSTLLASPAVEKETITFDSADGLSITADLYLEHQDPGTPLIVLFHQAGWSRGEYLEIAPRLNELGFNCLAVDQRSGSEINDVPNETAKLAQEKGLATTYADALPDLIAALKYAREKHAKGQLLAWGSSYAAALVLKVAGDHPELVDGALAFAPGEYFEKLGKPADWIRTSAKKIQQPVFVTSARSEKENWAPIFEVIPSKAKFSYLPETAGNHGSRALWKRFDDSPGYWKELEAFLKRHFPRPAPAGSGLDPATARREIDAMYNEWERARVELDKAKMESIVAPEFYVLLDGREISREEFLDNVSQERMGARLTRFDADILTVKRTEKEWVVVITEKLEFEIVGPKETPDKVYSFWVTRDGCRKEDGRWLVTSSEAIGYESWPPGAKPPFPGW